jgi:hypothetical protein
MIFDEEGLQVQIVKMFLDFFHQPAQYRSFDPEKATRNMLYFVQEGLELAS